MHKRIMLALTFILCVSSMQDRAYAAVPYRSHAYGVNNFAYLIQSPYVPAGVIGNQLYTNDNGNRISVKGLDSPAGLSIDSEDNVYVADTKNNRVVKITKQGVLLKELGTGQDQKAKIKEPEGVYVSSNGDIYICDTGNHRIAIFDSQGHYIDEVKKPDDRRIQDLNFIPTRVSIDIRGFMFVNLKGVNQGLMVLTPDKRFNGFFGSNQVHMTFLNKLMNVFYTNEQKNASAVESASVSDIAVDREGYIYTCTLNAEKEQIKKYNIAGENLFKGKNMQVGSSATMLTGSYSGLTVDDFGNIFALDTASGRIYQFDRNGAPVLSFGRKLETTDLKIGLLGDPVSIKVNSKGFLFVSDRAFKGIQVYRPTDFVKKIHFADSLFNDGKYDEAAKYAKDILKSNSFYYRSLYIIGKALYKDKQWKAAMDELKSAYDTKDYSDAFWEMRLRWVQKSFGKLAAAFVVVLIAVWVAARLRSKKAAERRR